MSRLKTLTLPLISLLAPWAAAPVHAQNTYFSLSTDKTFRQSPAREHAFRGGSLNTIFRDGIYVYQGGCQRVAFWPANVPMDPCPLGATGFLSFGGFGEPPTSNPYTSVTTVIPAFVIEPTQPDFPHLYAAPASKLPRPLYGFRDAGLGVFYNLLGESLREYRISLYTQSRSYTAGQLSLMNSETVPGSYFFRFPKLNNPTQPVSIASTIRALPEGFARINSQFVGVNFNTGLGFDSDGFMRVSFNKPTTVRWTGFAPNLLNANVDKLYFSIRYLLDPNDPLSETVFFNPTTGQGPASLFPGFVSGRDPRILLPTPFVSSFTIPPIFRVGQTGVIELELNRNLASSGAIYDTSTRRYQIPVRFVSAYSDYASRSFGNVRKKIGITEDFDSDGFNNLTEWVLNSRAQDINSLPIRPTPSFFPAVESPNPLPGGLPVITPAYFGFKVQKPLGYIPDVVQVLQRSTSVAPAADVWVDMVTDANWTVLDTDNTIELLSRTGTAAQPTQPPGTAAHKFRFRVALAP